MSRNYFSIIDFSAKTISDSCRRFLSDKRGATALTFALTLTPLMLGVGVAIDYGYKIKAETDLRNAADAAALEAAINAKNYIQQNNKMTFEEAKQLAEKSARTVFAANAYAYKDLKARPLAVNLTKDGTFISASVVYDIDLPGFFSPLVGLDSLRVANIASPSIAKSQTHSFANYFLMLDLSASMGLPTTTAEQKRFTDHLLNTDLKVENGDKTCVFACHGVIFEYLKRPAGEKREWRGYRITRKYQAATINELDSPTGAVEYCERAGQSNCIQLRTDAMSYAIKNLLLTINKTEIDNNISDQFQVGVYPFIVNLATFKALTTDIASISAVVNQIPSLLDTHDPSNVRGTNPTAVMRAMGSGGTHFENAIPQMHDIVKATPNRGDGTEKGKRNSFVFLITDGMRDPQVLSLKTGDATYSNSGANGGDHSFPIDQSYCTTMKNDNITLGILYTPYVVQTETSFASGESGYANKAIPSLGPELQKCASPGYFFTANSADDIDKALKTMFYQSMERTRLSH